MPHTPLGLPPPQPLPEVPGLGLFRVASQTPACTPSTLGTCHPSHLGQCILHSTLSLQATQHHTLFAPGLGRFTHSTPPLWAFAWAFQTACNASKSSRCASCSLRPHPVSAQTAQHPLSLPGPCCLDCHNKTRPRKDAISCNPPERHSRSGVLEQQLHPALCPLLHQEGLAGTPMCARHALCGLQGKGVMTASRGSKTTSSS